MKGLVERDLGRYITEAQFIKAMIESGYKYDNGYFNSILVSKLKLDLDHTIQRYWGLNKSSHAIWLRNKRAREESSSPRI